MPGVHVRDVLDAIATRTPGLVDKFGGHAMAAGLTLREASLPVFEAEFAHEVERWIDEDTLAGHLHTDGELLAGEFNVATAAGAARRRALGFGLSRSRCSTGVFGVADTRVVGNRHLKLRLRAASGEVVDAIAFRYLDGADAPEIRAHDRVQVGVPHGRRRLHGHTQTAARDGVGREALSSGPDRNPRREWPDGPAAMAARHAATARAPAARSGRKC